MAEIQITRIRSVYGDIRGLLSQIPLPETSRLVHTFIVNGFNSSLDELSQLTNTDYSRYKVPKEEESPDWPGEFDSIIVLTQIGRVISRLEEEYGLGPNDQSTSSPGIVIFNKNQSEISLQINYTINDLINSSNNEESKKKLEELKDELEKPNKNWGTIKNILIWILDFSKDLFLKIIPIILEKKI